MEPEPEPPGAAFFTLEPEPEPTQVGRSRSRLRDLSHLEPEPELPKKVAAPQHWLNEQLKYFLKLISLFAFRIVKIWYYHYKNQERKKYFIFFASFWS